MLFHYMSLVLFGLATLTSAQVTPVSPHRFAIRANSTSAAAGTGLTTLATVTTRPSATRASTSTAASPTASALGGIAAPPITNSADPDRPFEVNGNTFDTEEAAVERSCAIQNNKCADAVNSGQIADAEVSDCADQEAVCINFGVAK